LFAAPLSQGGQEGRKALIIFQAHSMEALIMFQIDSMEALIMAQIDYLGACDENQGGWTDTPPPAALLPLPPTGVGKEYATTLYAISIYSGPGCNGPRGGRRRRRGGGPAAPARGSGTCAAMVSSIMLTQVPRRAAIHR
jgi:hypothetical protein